jgi:Putative beta-barrel porin-2, OmpL-like. bbp2
MIGGQVVVGAGVSSAAPSSARTAANPFSPSQQASQQTVAPNPFADDELPQPSGEEATGPLVTDNPFSSHPYPTSTPCMSADGCGPDGYYEDGCCPQEPDPWDMSNYCDWTMCREFWEQSKLPQGPFAAAWLEQGFTWNPDSPANRFNLPVTFNDRSNEYQMNQFYAVFGREACDSGCDWDAGCRLDLLYGTDYFYTTALGLETYNDGSQKWNSSNGPRAGGNAALYGLAMPQLYAEINAPVAYGLNIKAGHFYSILNYESVMAPENFFYSHSYSFQYGEPKTFTGLLGDLQVTRNWSAQAGITRGWDAWENPNDDASFLGGVGWTSRDRWSNIRFAITTGPDTQQGANDLTAYSLIYTQRINRCLTYALEQNFGSEENGAIVDDQFVDADWYGLTQYLTYCVDRQTQVGARFEWFHDSKNARVLAIPIEGSAGHDFYELTLGVNHRPLCCERWELKSELRWDWSNVDFPGLDVFGMYDDFTDHDQFTWAFSAVTTF